MNYVLRILNKHLTNERQWLRLEGLARADAKYREGARMAKERIPQLEKAIELILNDVSPKEAKSTKPKAKTEFTNQLTITF